MISAKIMQNGPVYAGGLVLIALSGSAYIAQSSFANADNVFLYFMFCYSLVVAFMAMRRFMRSSVEEDQKVFHRTLLWTLFLISSYSLNESMRLFAPSVMWFKVMLITVMLNLLLYAYWQYMATWIRMIMSFVNGVGMTVFFYLSLYLLPGYPLGGLVIPVLGVSFHLFVPLCLLIHSYRLQSRVKGLEDRWVYFFLAGFLLSISVCVIYALRWNSRVSRLNKIIESTRGVKNDLNSMLNAVQYIPASAMNINVLENARKKWNERGGSSDFFSLGVLDGPPEDVLFHDPLLQIASFIGGPLRISTSERTELLRMITDSRHERQQRLWSDHDLRTLSVDTRIDIWPSCYLAYTEKTISLGVDQRASSRGFKEAIYNFELPQGSVVTSLSLWVNGKEEKGILTTREKADSAYRTIVGVEARDPSVVHWQEGNTVVVRVFPVISTESRKFRLGITSPLSVKAGKAVYNSIYFKGPDASGALETISTQLHETVGGLEISKDFVSLSKQAFTRKGNCNPVFSLAYDARLSGNCTYSFDGFTYKMLPYTQEIESVDLNNLYLDVNSSWDKTEFLSLAALSEEQNIFIWNDAMIRLTKANADSYWQQLSQKKFGIFPFYKINDANQSMVITKNSSGYLDLAFLKETPFYVQTQNYFSKNTPIRLFNLGGVLLPYQKSLVEYRKLVYDEGSLQELQHRIKNKNFPRLIENENLVVIPQSSLAIYRTEESGPSGGPDHLLRLFAYNAVMRLYGTSMHQAGSQSDPILKLAKKANIVTPVSNLIVLESAKDYERFDIAADQNALGNAALVNQGAVPEPHEWVLLIAGLLLIIYYGFLSRRKNSLA